MRELPSRTGTPPAGDDAPMGAVGHITRATALDQLRVRLPAHGGDWLENRANPARLPLLAQRRAVRRIHGRGGLDPAELLLLRELAVVEALHSVTERGLDVPDSSDQADESADLDRRGLVAAPHRTVQGDVALDVRGPDGDRRPGGGQPSLVTGIADRHPGPPLLQGVDDLEVQL